MSFVFPTSVDYANASTYAINRIKYDLCNNPELLKKYPGIKWFSEPQNQLYPIPKDVSNISFGHCRITTEELCQKLSAPSKTSVNTPCSRDEECDDPYKYRCDLSKNECVPKHPYLEWLTDPNDNQNKCAYGNFVLKNWCIYPQDRSDDTKIFPPFHYNQKKARCEISPDYCKRIGTKYTDKQPEGTAYDLNSKGSFIKGPSKFEYKGYPDCYRTTTQAILEDYFIGKTLFRGFMNMEGFDNVDIINKLADRKHASRYHLLSKDFGGKNIHLYEIIWKPEFKINPHAGFFADEVIKVFPENVKTYKGTAFIQVTKNDVKKDTRLKRIFMTLNAGTWISDLIVKMVQMKTRQK
jgi:hypothetical protein